ncbi:cathepsin b, putative [Perkinsus marinus ATCC 50983]|uniref:Cathepsin b, putative n=1 Tax=Perkinsus marinus (strain ATCC 50983 / TXsc) TaxID=423536 RepID=C5K8G0_PERM5|nr:cathepsin b, putative [Perkinsus marinus ATCC 50983]EER19167.1 cathepsin b, putative [Perkinsus marinus ATCC 50983]|eukprot:XP_002787371.1 cathepsin b, putative [Perkinsus marinus ATCC 50983]
MCLPLGRARQFVAKKRWGLVTSPRLDPEAAFPSSSGNSRMHLVRRKREADAHRRLTPWEASDVVKILVDKVPDNCTHAQALEVVASLTGEGCLTEELGRELATDEADFSPIANLFSSPETDVPSAELIRTITEEFPWKFLSDERLQHMVYRLSKQAEKLMTKGDLKGAQEMSLKALRFEGCRSRAVETEKAAKPLVFPETNLDQRTGYAARSGAAISSLLQPDEPGEKGPPQRDAFRENLQSIKRISEERKTKKIKEEEIKRQIPFKIKRFAEVSSRFMQEKRSIDKTKSDANVPPTGKRETVRREEKVSGNCMEVPQGVPKVHKDITRRDRARLREILAEQEKLKEAPPGYRYMGEDEQKDVLNNLNKRKTELEKEYLGLPLRIERERQRERQRTIEASIAEIDAAIRKFSEADVEEELLQTGTSPERLVEIFNDTKPVLLQSVVDTINSMQDSWTASKDQPRFKGMSQIQTFSHTASSNDFKPQGQLSEADGCWPYPFQKCNHVPTEKTEYPKCKDAAHPPLPPCRTTCTNKAYKRSLKKDVHRAKGWRKVLNNAQSVKQEIFDNGPVFSAFKMYEDFRYYKSGVYVPTTEEFHSFHLIKIIGWGVHPDAQDLGVVSLLNEEGCSTEELRRELATDEADFSPIANLFTSPETDVPSTEVIEMIMEEFPWKSISFDSMDSHIAIGSMHVGQISLKALRLEDCRSRAVEAERAAKSLGPSETGLDQRTDGVHELIGVVMMMMLF